jgi:hypothetical protein
MNVCEDKVSPMDRILLTAITYSAHVFTIQTQSMTGIGREKYEL